MDLFTHPDIRGEVVCWYSSALNGIALRRAFEDTGDIDLLEKGYPGVMSVLRNITPDGAGFGWFMVTPGVFAHEPPRTFENGPGLWAFLKAAKAYVIKDAALGVIGFGCSLELTREQIKVYPKDGLKRRVMFVEEKIGIKATTAEINAVTLNRTDRSLEFQIGDSTGLVKMVHLAIQGLPKGEYKAAGTNWARRFSASDKLDVSVPIAQAGTLRIERV